LDFVGWPCLLVSEVDLLNLLMAFFVVFFHRLLESFLSLPFGLELGDLLAEWERDVEEFAEVLLEEDEEEGLRE
jgi:hypothetical protein